MTKLASEIARLAEVAVAMSHERSGHSLDYSEETLFVLEAMACEASPHLQEMTDHQRQGLVQALGSYLLEVARRSYGGTYQWSHPRGQPVLVFGEPAFHIALLAWGKVKGRLSGDPADDLVFHYNGFAERAADPKPGERVLFE
jgi:hypothetical protein